MLLFTTLYRVLDSEQTLPLLWINQPLYDHLPIRQRPRLRFALPRLARGKCAIQFPVLQCQEQTRPTTPLDRTYTLNNSFTTDWNAEPPIWLGAHPSKRQNLNPRVFRERPAPRSHVKEPKVSLGTSIMNMLFGCRHRELSRAFTAEGETYKVCLKCGTRLQYSWQTMSLVRKGSNGRPIPTKSSAAESRERAASSRR